MRRMTILAACAALATAPIGLASAALAQTTPPAANEAPTPAPAPSPAPATQIKNVEIIDISELPPAAQSQVDQIVKQRSDADLQTLRSSLDATPSIASKMKEEGVTSAQVIVASLDEQGTLTLVTRKAG